MAKITPEAIPKLKAIIDQATSDADGPPGVVCVAVNKHGELIFEHASGTVGAGVRKPMLSDNVFWIASCTKMITGIACMQLVEQGKLSLDDCDQVATLAPELKDIKVLQDGKLVPKKRGITLRMLLSHTAGFGYAFFSQQLMDWAGPVGLDEFSGSDYDYLSQPLIHQPGEKWEYGIGVDWAGQLVERVSGLKLNDYFQRHIFQPLSLTGINMFPTTEMKRSLVYMNTKVDGGYMLNPDGHLNRRPLTASCQEEINSTFQAGGAGLFATPADYAQIIATLLNNGIHPGTGHQVLRKETVDLMFSNQIPDMPNFGRQGIVPSKRCISNPFPELYPEPHDVAQGWGLTFFLHLTDGALHSKGTAWWSGLPNLYWWADRERGIGGMVASQIIPAGDPKIAELWVRFEAEILQNLQ